MGHLIGTVFPSLFFIVRYGTWHDMTWQYNAESLFWSRQPSVIYNKPIWGWFSKLAHGASPSPSPSPSCSSISAFYFFGIIDFVPLESLELIGKVGKIWIEVLIGSFHAHMRLRNPPPSPSQRQHSIIESFQEPHPGWVTACGILTLDSCLHLGTVVKFDSRRKISSANLHWHTGLSWNFVKLRNHVVSNTDFCSSMHQMEIEDGKVAESFCIPVMQLVVCNYPVESTPRRFSSTSSKFYHLSTPFIALIHVMLPTTELLSALL